MNKVRVNAWYEYHPVMLDVVHPPHGRPKAGDRLQVRNLPGCPRTGTMGHCHVYNSDGQLAGLVCVNSLAPIGGGA